MAHGKNLLQKIADILLLATVFMAFLYGFGYTKLTLCVNFCRVLVFRVPLLWIIVHFTNLGIEAMGIVMCVSNILVSIMSGIIVGVLYYKVKHNKISIDNKQISK